MTSELREPKSDAEIAAVISVTFSRMVQGKPLVFDTALTELRLNLFLMESNLPLPNCDEDWRARLGDKAFYVMRQGGTEAPFSGTYDTHFEQGDYHCKGCGSLLFTDTHKFNSGCGWPAFDQSVPGAISYLRDTSFGMIRIETRCANCDSHLGHVFDDGPQHTTGKRYCINSICLVFKPRAQGL